MIKHSLVLIFLISCCLISCNNQKKEMVLVEGKAGIYFNETDYNFGEIEYKGTAEHNFTFTNNGDQPLLITNVRTSCGCTASNYSKKPYNAGSKGDIGVSYDTERVGNFSKTIMVYSNALSKPVKLTITGTVVKEEEKEVEKEIKQEEEAS